MQTITSAGQSETLLSPQSFFIHWQGHRSLTRKVIESFPENELFKFSIGGMRTFALMAMELIDLAEVGIKGVATRDWELEEPMLHYLDNPPIDNKADLLSRWDRVTETLNNCWPLIPAGRFEEVDRAFGQYEGTINDIILYWVDNEIHHRAQGYVYLRSLGIEPPSFWDR